MKKASAIIAYVLLVGALITAVLVLGNKNHGECPVCNHSLATEGNISKPFLSKSIK